MLWTDTDIVWLGDALGDIERLERDGWRAASAAVAAPRRPNEHARPQPGDVVTHDAIGDW